MSDPLNRSGDMLGSRGAPGSKGAFSFGAQLLNPVRPQARTGTAIGAAAVQLVRGVFFQNLATVVQHARRSVGIGTDGLASNSGGAPPPSTASGWDGVPLDQYGR